MAPLHPAPFSDAAWGYASDVTHNSEPAEHYENAAKLRYLADAAQGPHRDELLARAATEREAGDRASRSRYGPPGGTGDGNKD